jgi:uncharacterized protein (TIGR02145 family)
MKSIIACIGILLSFFVSGSSGFSALSDWKSPIVSTIKIGNQEWMAKNYDLPMPNSFYYERDSVNNVEEGRMYFFSSAMAACPKGFHLATDEEWQTMVNFLGGDSLAKVKLMKGGETGMNLTLSGYRSANSANDLFGKKGEIGFYWTSTVKAEQVAYGRTIDKSSNLIESKGYRRANAFSVRYLKD